VDYLRSILDEVGLGGERLLLFHLPGTADEDLALAVGKPVPAYSYEAGQAGAAVVREGVTEALERLAANPMQTAPVPVAVAVETIYQQLDTSNDDSEE
jgi:hypothetical protein